MAKTIEGVAIRLFEHLEALRQRAEQQRRVMGAEGAAITEAQIEVLQLIIESIEVAG